MRDHPETDLPIEPDARLAAALRAASDADPPAGGVDWRVLHERLLMAAAEPLRARREETPWRVLARWARPVLPGAMAASACLAVLLATLSDRPARETEDSDSRIAATASALDAVEGLAVEDPTLARLLEGDEQAILDVAIGQEN